MPETFYYRLISEKTELEERITKLASFLKSDKVDQIDPAQLPLLQEQYIAMNMYSHVLGKRITLLKNEQ